jgi:hypothetical protein
MEPLYWPNTVQLTLSIQYPSELVLLLKRDALPAIEHLNITNEQVRTVFSLRRYIPVSNIHLCDYNLREIADGTRLRSLLLRYISLSDIILLIGSLTMPLLEKLILIDLYDDSKLSFDVFLRFFNRDYSNSFHMIDRIINSTLEMKDSCDIYEKKNIFLDNLIHSFPYSSYRNKFESISYMNIFILL